MGCGKEFKFVRDFVGKLCGISQCFCKQNRLDQCSVETSTSLGGSVAQWKGRLP